MSKISILIADDEALIRLDLKEMLELAGYVVCGEANDGLKAVELAKKLLPDLVILDVKMPGLDGLEVAKIMQTMNIPVVLLTAYNKPNFINRAEKISVYGYLVKPVTERNLLPALQIAYARWKEMQSVQQELKGTQIKLNNQIIIGRARALLAQKKNISEYDAHQQLVHEAMELGVTLVDRATQILKESPAK